MWIGSLRSVINDTFSCLFVGYLLCEGWQANVEKWNREGLTPPIVAPGMAR